MQSAETSSDTAPDQTPLKLLLDTHIWLWALLDPERLSRNVRAALESPNNELWLSPISIWEALVLAERGRIKVTGDTRAWIDGMVRAMPRREAPLTHEVAIESRRIALSHQDPADRFIAATARVYDLTLVTADERLLNSTEYATFGS
ncbi:MAG: type II toxin-antitoxin system VapC family toxin [Gemmatimonadaceae bacterium]